VKWLAVKITDPSGIFFFPEILIWAFEKPEKVLSV
jgi:hypothetical protein